MKRLPADQEARTRFETDVERNAVVEAGAGTGKTTLIVARFLALVTGAEGRTPVPIERIGLMTFTEAAAGELQARVGDGLSVARLAALEAGDLDRVKGLSLALANVGSASISTIHGFSQRILRDHALAADLDPNFEVLGAIARQRLIEDVFDLWFDEVSACPEVRRALSFGVGLGQVETLARDLVDLGPEALEVKPPELPRLEGPGGLVHDVFCLAKGLLERFGNAHEDLAGAGLPAEMAGDKLVGLLRALNELLGEHGKLLRADQDSAALESLEFELMKPRWEKGLPYGGRLSQAKWAKAFGGIGADYKQLTDDMAARLIALREAIGAHLTMGLTGVLGSFRKHFEHEKQRRSVVDFDDLLVLAERLVRVNANVRLAVMRRFDSLFVDEFQDTDPVQARLVFFLAGGEDSVNETDWTRVTPVPGRLVLVGDPKQSVYRFRKADVETYQRCCRLLNEADPKASYTITTNFRTDGALVDFVNRSFQEGPGKMVAPLDGDWQADYIGLVPFHNERGDASPVLALVQSEEDSLESAAKNLEAEAAAVACFLAERLGEGSRYKNDQGQPLELGDVAVLGRTRASLDAYAIALATAGIAYVFEGGGELFKSREVLEALTLLTAIVDPGRQTAVVGALRSIWIGRSDDALVRHRIAGGGWDPNTAEAGHGEEQVLADLKWLGDQSRRAQKIGPQAFIEETLEATAIAGLLLLRPAGPQALMDLVRLRSLLLSLVVEEGLGLGAAVRFAGRLAQSGSDEKGACLLTKGAVRLMTVHASKGLEFGVVVLAQPSRKMNPGGDIKPWLDSGEVIVSLGKCLRHPRFDELNAVEKQRAEAERLRLFYVAQTRAKHFLVVPVFAPVRSGTKLPKLVHERIRMGAFGAYLGSAFTTGDGFAKSPGIKHIASSWTESKAMNVAAGADVAQALKEDLAACGGSSGALEHRRRVALGARRTGGPLAFGPSAVADALAPQPLIGDVKAAPRVTVGYGWDAGRRPRSSDEDRGPNMGERARGIGTLVHLAIERRLSAEQARSLAELEGLQPDEVTFVANCIASEARLDSHTRAFASGSCVFDEVPVLWGDIPAGASLLMNGFIDRLIRFEDGSVEIVDFKTDRFDASDKELLREHTDHHMVQLGLYALALEAAGFTIRRMTLAYVAAGCDDCREFDAERQEQAAVSLVRFRELVGES